MLSFENVKVVVIKSGIVTNLMLLQGRTITVQELERDFHGLSMQGPSREVSTAIFVVSRKRTDKANKGVQATAGLDSRLRGGRWVRG